MSRYTSRLLYCIHGHMPGAFCTCDKFAIVFEGDVVLTVPDQSQANTLLGKLNANLEKAEKRERDVALGHTAQIQRQYERIAEQAKAIRFLQESTADFVARHNLFTFSPLDPKK